MPQIYPFLTMFWGTIALGFGVLYREAIDVGYGPIDENRGKLSLLAFVLCAYNLFRWSLERLRRRYEREATNPPPRPRESDPQLDFSDDPPERR